MTTSGLPPTAVATTGSPLAIASSSELQMPSATDGSTKTSIARSSSGTRLLDPSRDTRCLEAGALGDERFEPRTFGPSPISRRRQSRLLR